MNGAVAAGHPLTAEAGARILAEGGNAVDACVAAALVAWVAESPLTGPGAGGFMLVHLARDRSDRLLDCFVAAPGRGLPPGERGAMRAVDVHFDERTSQVFLIGAASVAVPGAPAGLELAHRRYGKLPWAELFGPAVEAAREGVRLNDGQAFLADILDPILRSEPEGRLVYGAERPLREGEEVVMADLARTLEWLAAEGAGVLYRGELARRLSETVLAGGGRVTEEDLAAYRVITRRPVRAAFRDVEFVSNPPPSSGGLLIAFALRVLEGLGPPRPAGSAGALAALTEAMREASLLRGRGFLGLLRRGGAAARVLADDHV
jgi:gamma-glutamyltranspeptidase/glutathione hydrolase